MTFHLPHALRSGRGGPATPRASGRLAGAPRRAGGRRQAADSGGAHPRHFALLEVERKLVVAHEKDGTVASFDIEADGRLRETGHRIVVPGACFVLPRSLLVAAPAVRNPFPTVPYALQLAASTTQNARLTRILPRSAAN